MYPSITSAKSHKGVTRVQRPCHALDGDPPLTVLPTPGDVNVHRVDPRLDYARELEQRDAKVAARIEHVVELGRRADELGSRAAAVAAELARLPERRDRTQAAADEAERDLAAASDTLADAARELSSASGDAADAAHRRLVRAETDVRAAEERHARLLARLAELDGEEQRLHGESGELRSLAAELAQELEREPRIADLAPPVGADLAGLQEWASRGHAAVLVVRSGLEAERDRIVREANELATSVLGESVPAMSAATVRERLASSLP